MAETYLSMVSANCEREIFFCTTQCLSSCAVETLSNCFHDCPACRPRPARLARARRSRRRASALTCLPAAPPTTARSRWARHRFHLLVVCRHEFILALCLTHLPVAGHTMIAASSCTICAVDLAWSPAMSKFAIIETLLCALATYVSRKRLDMLLVYADLLCRPSSAVPADANLLVC